MSRVTSVVDLIDRLPKVELHVHLEGTLEPELAFRLAARNGVALPVSSVEEMRRLGRWTDLPMATDPNAFATFVIGERTAKRTATGV